MLILFSVLIAVLLIQTVVALAESIRFWQFVRRSSKPATSPYTPEVTVILPCKGVHPRFEENLDFLLSQDYPNYRVIFAMASREDPAFSFLEAYLKKNRVNFSRGLLETRRVVADLSEGRGEKVNNSLCALSYVGESTAVLVFTDADAVPKADWLRSLVGPLGEASVTVSTGFRWYLPGTGFASQLRAAWDTSIATLLGEHDRNFAWGGSMAIRRTEFKRLNVQDAWRNTVSDDYALSDVVRRAGGRIRFEPRCLLASKEESPLDEFLRWSNRQIIITRVYASQLWGLGLGAHLSYGLAFLVGFGVILGSLAGNPKKPATALLAGGLLMLVQLLGIVKGLIRLRVAQTCFPREETSLLRYGSAYWRLSPLVPWIMLYNFVAAALTRRIEWAGVHYDLRSPTEVVVLDRETNPH